MSAPLTPSRAYTAPLSWASQTSSSLASLGSTTVTNTYTNLQGFAKTSWFYRIGIIIMVTLFLTDLAVVNYQQTIQTSLDVLWEGGIFPFSNVLANYLLVTLKNIYEWLILRIDDVLIYLYDCIRTAVDRFGQIQDFLSVEGVSDSIDIVYDAIVCISGWAYNVESVNVPYFTDFVENSYDFFICGTNVLEGILVNIIRGTLFSEDCVWCLDLDPSHNCFLVGNAFPGITPNCTKQSCHNYEVETFGCLGDYLAYWLQLFDLDGIANFYQDLMDAYGCIMSLYKRPLFVITGWVTNLAVHDGCINFDDIPDQFIEWMGDIIECADQMLNALTGGALNDFFEFVFRYLFNFIQVIIDSINIIFDCMSNSTVTNCFDQYPNNCHDNGIIATGGLQTCWNDLVDCWDDPSNVLMEPLFVLHVFDLIDGIFVVIDTVTCTIYQFINCVSSLPNNADWSTFGGALDCAVGLFTGFGGSGKNNLDWLGWCIDMINALESAYNTVADTTTSLWDDFTSLFRRKRFEPNFNFAQEAPGAGGYQSHLSEVIEHMERVTRENGYHDMRKYKTDKCISNVVYHSKKEIFEKKFPYGCEPIEAIKKVIICFLDGGNCVWDPRYDETIFKEYNPLFTKKATAMYADYIWDKVLVFLNVTDNPCYATLSKHHPLKGLNKPSAAYTMCMRMVMPINEFKLMRWMARDFGNRKFSNSTELIDPHEGSPLSVKLMQRSKAMLDSIKHSGRRSRNGTSDSREQRVGISSIGKKIYERYQKSEYSGMLSSYAKKSRVLRDRYYRNSTKVIYNDIEQYPDVEQLLASRTGMSDEEHMKMQSELFLNYLGIFRDSYYKGKTRPARGCHKWNNLPRCRPFNKWYQTEEDMPPKNATDMIVFSKDDGVMLYRKQSAEEIIAFNQMRDREYIESDADKQLMYAKDALYKVAMKYNFTSAIKGVSKAFGIGDIPIIKVPHGIYTALMGGDTKSLALWMQGNVEYSIGNGFEEIKEVQEAPQQPRYAPLNSTWESFTQKMKESAEKKKESRWNYSKKNNIELDLSRRYLLFPFFNIRVDDVYGQTDHNITFNGVHTGRIFNFLEQIDNSAHYPEGEYEVAFHYSNGSVIKKQFSSANFNFNTDLIKFIDSVISFFGAPSNWLLTIYNDFIDTLASPDYVHFFKTDLIDYIETFFICHIRENIDGTYLWNVFCGPLMPITIFSWIDYVPNKFIPLQIPWPQELIVQDCVNVYNGKHGILTFRKSDNCLISTVNRPFCPDIDYCQRTYRQCADIGFSPDALDPLLFAIAVAPQLINWFFFGVIDLWTALFISVFLTMLTIPVTGLMAGIIILGLFQIYWGISIVLPGVPLSFIVSTFLMIIIIYIPSLINMAGLVFTISSFFLVFWLYCVVFGFSGFTINTIQVMIDVVNFFNNTPPLSWLLPDLQFLVDRFSRFDYNYGEVPWVDTLCFIINYGNFALSFLVIFVSAYVLMILGQTVWETGKTGANAVSGAGASSSAARAGSTAETMGSHSDLLSNPNVVRGTTIRNNIGNSVKEYTRRNNNAIRSNVSDMTRNGYGVARRPTRMVVPDEYVDTVHSGMKVSKAGKAQKQSTGRALSGISLVNNSQPISNVPHSIIQMPVSIPKSGKMKKT